ncbi:hypothetical protein [Atlantibacter sp.]|uniref:hypothetical protein n=1 Tax=Atlantibacter sp. TaxID=1903473 RepID=UPI0028B20CBC|nr:hypothetical protein [Atlantibacter sp.]
MSLFLVAILIRFLKADIPLGRQRPDSTDIFLNNVPAPPAVIYQFGLLSKRYDMFVLSLIQTLIIVRVSHLSY